jgi:hypothetical protein
MSGSRRLRFLWSAANVLHAQAPSVSRAMGARLVQAAGPDGMSASARRLHCAACSALLAPRARVRVRPDRRQPARRRRGGRREGEASLRNRVVRTCGQCRASNHHNGARRTDEDAVREWAAVMEPKSPAVAAAAEQARGVKRTGHGAEPSCGANEGAAFGRDGHGEGPSKRKKRKKTDPVATGFLTRPTAQSAERDPSALSSSFLFQPL